MSKYNNLLTNSIYNGEIRIGAALDFGVMITGRNNKV